MKHIHPTGSLNRIAAFMMAVAVMFSLSACDENVPTGSVTLSQSAAVLEVGEELILTAVASSGETDIVWESSSPSVATVSESGVVRAISEGETEIAAISSDAVAICRVTVKNKYDMDAYVFMPITSARLKVGDTITLDAVSSSGDAVEWRSSSNGVASVSGGVVTGIASGTARIIATAGGASGECVITVTDSGPTSDITISRYFATVKEGQSVMLSVTSSGGAVTWMSTDPAIATVSGGAVTGVSLGRTVISAWAPDASVQCEIKVTGVQDVTVDGYTLVWNDEFDGSSLDDTKWGYMLGVQDEYGESKGPMLWGNNELQYYTEEAATVSGGTLNIAATRADMPYGREFTSARISTRDKGYWTYGYFEARMKTPAIIGMWPAFWMMPQPSSPTNSHNKYGGWAACGEIDIMEARGSVGVYVDTTLHFGNSGYSTNISRTTRMSTSTEEWHNYALEWLADRMVWYVDGLAVLTVNSSEWWSAAAPDSATAPFDTDFYILLDLAVGGNYDRGNRPPEDFVSASMQVDYVRVYKPV